MTAASHRRKDAPPPRESAVYDGGRLLGCILPKAGAFVARSPAGRPIGSTFNNEVEAMRAICAADRLARLAAGAQPEVAHA